MFAIRSWIRCGINRTDSESFEIFAASRSTARSHVQKRLKTMFFCFIFGGLIYLDMRGMYGVCHVKLVWSGTQLYWFRIFSYMFLHFLTCSYSFLYFPSWETHILCWMGHSVFSSAQHPWSPPSAPLHLVLLWLDVENPMGKSNRKMICKCGCSTSMLVYRRVHIKLYIIYTCAQKKDIKLSNWGPIIDITIEAGWSVKVHFFFGPHGVTSERNLQELHWGISPSLWPTFHVDNRMEATWNKCYKLEWSTPLICWTGTTLLW